MKHIKLIKQVYHRAVEDGYQLINPLHKFKCTYIEQNNLNAVKLIKILHLRAGRQPGCAVPAEQPGYRILAGSITMGRAHGSCHRRVSTK